MAKGFDESRLSIYIAFTSGLLAVLAAVASFQANGYSSLMLEEKNNSILYQAQANRLWNNFLAASITTNIRGTNLTVQQSNFKLQAEDLEKKSNDSDDKFKTYFGKNSQLVNAGTFLEIAIALASTSVLVKRKTFWFLSLGLGLMGAYFLAMGLL